MSQQISGGYSPIRDKRRQSDAKWRASVATCYDALKYVIPNVKNLSKKKISKALILQECEKHIQDLEETISYLFHVECKNQGQVALWKEGKHWSPCSMDKLHTDFSEKQRRVFHTSAHGRRCYNLLQDIQEEVFNMTTDSKQMTFIREDSLNLISASENLTDSKNLTNSANLAESVNLTDCMSGTSSVSIFEIPLNSANEIALAEDGTVTVGYSQITVDQVMSPRNREDRLTSSKRGLCAPPVASREDNIQVRQQPRPRQRLFDQVDNDIDTALLSGRSDRGAINASTVTVIPSSEPVYLLSADSCRSEKKHYIVHCVASSASSLSTSASSSISFAVSDISGKSINNVCSQDTSENCKLKLDEFDNSLYVLPSEREYTCLLRSLEAEKEQEVPCLETPVKTTRIKRPRLSNSGNDTDCLNSYRVICDGNSQDTRCYEHSAFKDIAFTDPKSLNDNYASHKISTLTSSADSFSSLKHLNVLDMKMEADEPKPHSSYDPLLSSLNTPKFDLDTPLFCQVENDVVLKQPPKYGSARKMLNFNCPSYSGWSHTSSRLVSPKKSIQASPVLNGFTPVKLPDDLSVNLDTNNPPESLVSPWKMLHSPFNSRMVPQGYIDTSSAVDLEDTLLCLETIDALDLVNGLGTEVTPAQRQNSDKPQEPEELQKAKVSPLLLEPDSRLKPKCRRSLESFYGDLSPRKDHAYLSDESHVVPQVGLTFWTSSSPHSLSHYDDSSMVNLEDSLICLETFDTIELDGII